jgi:uncharacterized membrane protein
MADGPDPPRHPLRRLSLAFVTGLMFLAPLLLTAAILGWVVDKLLMLLGPHSLVGEALTAGGHLFVRDPLAGFALGLLFVAALITLLGWLVMTRARRFMIATVDGFLGAIPGIGAFYRPVAQLVRGMSGGRSDEMSAMRVCAISFGGGIETLGLLVAADAVDAGDGIRSLVLVPTAPVPVGGALLLLPSARVRPVPGMQFDDLARFYMSMGVSLPQQLRAAAGAAPLVIPG